MTTLEEQQQARVRAVEMIEKIRSHFKDGCEKYSNSQMWQAMLDARAAEPEDAHGILFEDAVAMVLFDHHMNGRTPPACPHWEDPA